MSNNKFSIRSLLVRPEIATLLMFFAIMIGFYLANERFLSARNIRIVMGITPEYIIVAIGIAILMISGEFDLSVGSMIAFAGVCIAIPITYFGWPLWFTIIVTFEIAILVGLFNGLLYGLSYGL